jgi:hypothetical protein
MAEQVCSLIQRLLLRERDAPPLPNSRPIRDGLPHAPPFARIREPATSDRDRVSPIGIQSVEVQCLGAGINDAVSRFPEERQD